MQHNDIQNITTGRLWLAKWYGYVQTQQQAQREMAHLNQRLRQKTLLGQRRFVLLVARMVLRFWCGEAIEGDFRELSTQARGLRRKQALLYLVYGQLLMSRRIEGATEALAEGFRQASPLLDPWDYWRVEKRHQLLKSLPLFDQPRPASDLHELLTEARVAQQFQKKPTSFPDKGLDITS